jgi:hypothetical protein
LPANAGPDFRALIAKHWAASASGDQETEHDIYAENVICDYPQSGERIRGRANLRAQRSAHPAHPSGFAVRRITGQGTLWVSECVITYDGKPSDSVSIMEFEGDKVVHETQYFAEPFAPAAWRSKWVEPAGTRLPK